MKSIKHYLKINLLMLFTLASLSSSMRIQIKTDSELSSSTQKTFSETDIKIKEEDNLIQANKTNQIPVSNNTNLSNQPNNQTFKLNVKNNTNLNSNIQFDPDVVSEPVKAKNSTTKIESDKNYTKNPKSYFDPDEIRDNHLSEKKQNKNKTLSNYYDNKNTIKNNTSNHFDPDKNHVKSPVVIPKSNTTASKPNKTINYFDPDKVDNKNTFVKPKSNNTANKPNKTINYFDPDKIEEKNTPAKPNKTNNYFDPDKIEDKNKPTNSNKTTNDSIANNTKIKNYFDADKMDDSPSATKKPNLTAKSNSASNPKTNSTKKSNSKNNNTTKINFDPDAISESKPSTKSNLKPKKPIINNQSFGPDAEITKASAVAKNPNTNKTETNKNNNLKPKPSAASAFGFDPDKISAAVNINVNLTPKADLPVSVVKNSNVKNLDPDTFEDIKNKNVKPKVDKDKYFDPVKIAEAAKIKTNYEKPVVNQNSKNEKDNKDLNKDNNANNKNNKDEKVKDDVQYYYLPKIDGSSASSPLGDLSAFPCVDCSSLSSSSPTELFLPEKPEIKFDSVVYVRQLSAGAKAALALEEINDPEYKQILNKGYETPTFSNKIIEKFPAAIAKQATVNFNWQPSSSLDANLWQNVEYNRYNNRLLDTSQFNTPAYFTSEDGANIIHAPSNSGMQIISPARSTVSSFPFSQFLDLENQNFLFDEASADVYDEKDFLKGGERDHYFDKFLGSS